VIAALSRRPGPPPPREQQGGVDQCQVGEGSPEVADEPPTVRVVVLGKQSDVVASRQRPLEQRAGLVGPAGQCESVGQPEGAGKKGAFALIDPIHGALCLENSARSAVTR